MCNSYDAVDIILISIMGVSAFCVCVLMVKVTIIDIFLRK